MKSKILGTKKVESSTRTVVFVHGSYEVGDKRKNVEAAERLASEGIASTVLYESSRDWKKCQCAKTVPDWIAAFDGKTYHHELADLLEVLDDIRNTLKPTEIYISGTSYGAGLALLAADHVSGITRLLLSAPQVTPPDHDNGPIYEGFPPHKKFAGVLRRFAGSLAVIIGDQDSADRWQDAHFILDNAATRRKTLSVLHASHDFGDRSDNPLDVTARFCYAEEHVRAFR